MTEAEWLVFARHRALPRKVMAKLEPVVVVPASDSGLSRGGVACHRLPARPLILTAVVCLCSALPGCGKRKKEEDAVADKFFSSSDGLTSVAYSHDGKRIASPVWGEVRVWDAHKGTPLLSPGRHELQILCVAFSPDGRRIASGGGSAQRDTPGELKVWDAEKGTLLHSLGGHRGVVRGVAFSPDGKRLASGGGSSRFAGDAGELRVWDAEKGTEVLSLGPHSGEVRGVAYSPDGKRIASISQNHLKVWDAQKGTLVADLVGSGDDLLALAYSPDGRRVVVGGLDRRLIVWDVDARKEILSIEEHGTGWIKGVAYSPDGRRIASSNRVGTVKVWDAERGGLIAYLGPEADAPNGTFAVAFSPDGRRIAGACGHNGLKVRDADKGTLLLTFKENDVRQ